MGGKWSLALVEERTTPRIGSQQVRIPLQNTRQIENSPSSVVLSWVCLPCLNDETWNWLTPPFSFLRWPCCDGAKRTEEYRQLRSTTGFSFTCLYHDPSLNIPDSTLRLPTVTETMQIQCWSLGPWTLRDFLYRFFYTSMFNSVSMCVCVCLCVWCVCLCECGVWIAPKKKTSMTFFLTLLLGWISHFLTIFSSHDE